MPALISAIRSTKSDWPLSSVCISWSSRNDSLHWCRSRRLSGWPIRSTQLCGHRKKKETHSWSSIKKKNKKSLQSWQVTNRTRTARRSTRTVPTKFSSTRTLTLTKTNLHKRRAGHRSSTIQQLRKSSIVLSAASPRTRTSSVSSTCESTYPKLSSNVWAMQTLFRPINPHWSRSSFRTRGRFWHVAK